MCCVDIEESICGYVKLFYGYAGQLMDMEKVDLLV
jgi:hypothetical protein